MVDCGVPPKKLTERQTALRAAPWFRRMEDEAVTLDQEMEAALAQELARFDRLWADAPDRYRLPADTLEAMRRALEVGFRAAVAALADDVGRGRERARTTAEAGTAKARERAREGAKFERHVAAKARELRRRTPYCRSHGTRWLSIQVAEQHPYASATATNPDAVKTADAVRAALAKLKIR